MKKIFLLLPLLFLTGCTINYKLDIDKEKINEHITGTVTKEESTTDIYETDISLYDYLTNYDQNSLFNDDTNFYDKKLTDEGNYYNYDAKFTYIGNYKDSNIINSCFENHDIIETEDFYEIHLSGNFYCLHSDKININVTTNMAVINDNADKEDNNTYSWVIDKSSDIDISLTISKTIKKFTPNKEKSIFTPYRIVTFILLIVLVIVSLFIYKKRNSEN